MRKILAATATLLLLTLPAAAQEAAATPAPAPSTLPGGASSSNESHGDWTVSCRMQGAAKQCVLSQALGAADTGERVLAVELAMPAANRSEGMLLVPFGLRLAEGVQLKVDGAQLGNARPFLTCVATGCLVPLAFDEPTLAAMRVGKILNVTATRADTPEPVALDVSLAGFTAAVNRVIELSK